jgi:predicted nucleic acid-binding protein
MKVTIDTNVLVQDFWVDSPHSKVFFEEMNIVPAELYIPEIVIDETINKYKESMRKWTGHFRLVMMINSLTQGCGMLQLQKA